MNKILLAIDVGNTNISFAVFSGDTLRVALRCGEARHKAADDYAVWLLQLLAFHGVHPEVIRHVALASVVPEADFPLKQLCQRYFATDPLVINAEHVDIPLKIDNPAELGADRIVNAYAARHFYGAPALVLDFGTATTVDVLDANGVYRGGVIAPGLNLSVQALYNAAAKLPRIALRRPERVLGTGTITAMQSGVYWGYAGLIEGLTHRLLMEVFPDNKDQVRIISTGGLGSLLAPALPFVQTHDEDLTVKGLNALYWKIKT